MPGRFGYRGVGLQTIDDKSRVALPSALRSILERNLGDAAATKEGRLLTVETHESDPVLYAYDDPLYEEQLAVLTADARAKAASGEASYADIMRGSNGIQESVGFDTNGRFVMPPLHKSEGNLNRYAFFYGRGDLIEIWDPKTLIAFDRAPPKLRSACQFYLDRAKIVL